MNERENRRTGRIKWGIIGILLGLVVIFLLQADISAGSIRGSAPKNPFAAALFLLLLYALKSATIFFPLIVLEIGAGYCFPAPIALALNTFGMGIVLTIPYWIGHAVGIRQVNKLTARYPKWGALMEKQESHSFFLCFFLRIISCLPGDIVTMYLGATHVPYWKNLLGGSLGILPGMILATLMGANIQDPTSPAFWISAGLTVSLAILSTVLYYFYLRKQKRRGHKL